MKVLHLSCVLLAINATGWVDGGAQNKKQLATKPDYWQNLSARLAKEREKDKSGAGKEIVQVMAAGPPKPKEMVGMATMQFIFLAGRSDVSFLWVNEADRAGKVFVNSLMGMPRKGRPWRIEWRSTNASFTPGTVGGSLARFLDLDPKLVTIPHAKKCLALNTGLVTYDPGHGAADMTAAFIDERGNLVSQKNYDKYTPPFFRTLTEEIEYLKKKRAEHARRSGKRK